MDKLTMQTPDLTQSNIEKLAALFPACVTETQGEDGKLKKAINFDLLRQILSDEVLEVDEAYEFTWVGKKAAIVEANKPIRKTLRPVKEAETIPTGADSTGAPYCSSGSVNWDTTENLYIEGDNLEVLKLLQESYLGKVKMIYIDPPYNTGKDTFAYPDKFTMENSIYEEAIGLRDESDNRIFQENSDANPRFHSNWCSMIYQRLMVARNVLSEDGIIFISIDEREYANLRNICNEIFGEKNYFGDLIWEATTQPTNAGNAKFGLQKKTESILLYGKNKAKVPGFILEEMDSSLNYPHKGRFGRCRFEIIEKSDSGDYSRPSMKFQILGQYPREGKRWQIGEATASELEKAGKLEIIDGIVKKAVYPEDEDGKKQFRPFWSLLNTDIADTAQNGKEALNSLMNAALGFDTVKPVRLIKKLLAHMGDDYVIMDFFSGSATTAHAVMQLNAEDGGNRKFIMVQLPEVCDEASEAYKAGYKNICEIGKERIRRAAKKIAEENPDKPFDGGFRVFKLDESNMTDVFYSAGEYDQNMLTQLESNIKPDRTDLDLLFGCLLEWGLPLSMPYTSEQIEDCTVHTYNSGDLIACFDENIPETVIKKIAKRQPLRAVFRDSSFASSPAKINVGEIFKMLAPDTRVKVL